MNTKDGFRRLLHKRRAGGIKNSQKMKSAFFDCFYVMPPLKKGVHYTYFLNLRSKKWKPAAPIFFDSLRIYGDVIQQWSIGAGIRISDYYYSQGRAHARHGERMNAAMLDGHVAALQPQSFADHYVQGIYTWREKSNEYALPTIYSFTQQLGWIGNQAR